MSSERDPTGLSTKYWEYGIVSFFEHAIFPYIMPDRRLGSVFQWSEEPVDAECGANFGRRALITSILLRGPALERPRRREALRQFLISSMYAPPAVHKRGKTQNTKVQHKTHSSLHRDFLRWVFHIDVLRQTPDPHGPIIRTRHKPVI